MILIMLLADFTTLKGGNFKGKSCCRTCHKPILIRANLSDTSVGHLKHKVQN